jgi:hypothetical protein
MSERINHRVVIYSKLISRSDLRRVLVSLSPPSREFGPGGDLIGYVADIHDTASHSAATRSIAATVVQHAE